MGYVSRPTLVVTVVNGYVPIQPRQHGDTSLAPTTYVTQPLLYPVAAVPFALTKTIIANDEKDCFAGVVIKMVETTQRITPATDTRHS